MEPLDLYEQNAGLILAAEEWAKVYKKDADSFGALVKAEAKLERVLIQYFKDYAEKAPNIVNWVLYDRKLAQVTAASDEFDVDVIVEEIPDTENGLVMQIVYEPIALAVGAGLAGAEASYKIVLPETSIADTISKVARESIAYLVGRRVDKDGNIVEAKNPEYKISDVTRQQIRDSIRTSLSLGETQQEATARLQQRIKDPKRAARIASTEAVNAYQGGQYEYAIATDAKKKEWQSLSSACPICLGNQAAGAIAIDAKFPSGHLAPSAHPYDRCGLRYVYQEELDLNV